MGSIRQRLQEGGPGSGNFGHSGRPGQVGGSAPGGGGAEASPRERKTGMPLKHLVSKALERNLETGGLRTREKSFQTKTPEGHKRYMRALSWMEKKAEKYTGKGTLKFGGRRGEQLQRMTKAAKSQKAGYIYGEPIMKGGRLAKAWGNVYHQLPSSVR